jgi:hypothetical protein
MPPGLFCEADHRQGDSTAPDFGGSYVITKRGLRAQFEMTPDYCEQNTSAEQAELKILIIEMKNPQSMRTFRK